MAERRKSSPVEQSRESITGPLEQQVHYLGRLAMVLAPAGPPQLAVSATAAVPSPLPRRRQHLPEGRELRPPAFSAAVAAPP